MDSVIGTLQTYEAFPSQLVPPRKVEVWLPPNPQPQQRYRVLYMHDGQNLFVPGHSIVGMDWGVDEHLSHLMHQQAIEPVMVVGVWNYVQRWAEYMPQAPLDWPQNAELRQQFVQKAGQPYSRRYLQFLVQELKPFIDQTYPTLPGPAHTFIMGSSMGGLISLDALCCYPHIFGGAGCLSTHWPAGGQALIDYFAQVLPKAGKHRLYFDYGTLGLDAQYEPWQQQMDRLLKQAGYVPHRNCLSLKFEGHDHNEFAWRERLQVPLQFLLGQQTA